VLNLNAAIQTTKNNKDTKKEGLLLAVDFTQLLNSPVFAIFSYFVSFVFFAVTTAVSRSMDALLIN